MKRFLLIFFAFYFIRLNTFACVISEDTIIKQDVKEGIKVMKDCTLTFLNEHDINIGNSQNNCSGIEIQVGVKLKIDVSSKHNVNIYGGYYLKNGNEYNCASIYVPPSSSLIIESNDTGSLILYPFDRSSGIGGNGVLIEKNETLESNQNAGEVIIKKGKVIVKDVIEPNYYGMGAMIGGGGICNIANDAKTLYGGDMERFEIVDGRVILSRDYSDVACGVGAMIGGGGIANLNCDLENIYGGNLMEITVKGGYIDILNKSQNVGVGAMIGGGGIYSYGNVSNISKGQIFLIDIYKKNIANVEDLYGDSGICNNDEKIVSGNQIRNIEMRHKTLKNHLVEKFLDVAMIGAGIFMIFELVT